MDLNSSGPEAGFEHPIDLCSGLLLPRLFVSCIIKGYYDVKMGWVSIYTNSTLSYTSIIQYIWMVNQQTRVQQETAYSAVIVNELCIPVPAYSCFYISPFWVKNDIARNEDT